MPSSEPYDSNKESVASLLRRERQKLSKFHRWTCQDDLMLRRAAEEGMSSAEIIDRIKFSVRFSPADVEERWAALLYDTGVADQTSKAMDVLQHTTKRVPWTEEEDRIIVDELTQRGFVSFHQLLDRHREQFHPSRTVRSLEAHFYRMKRNGMFDHIQHFHTSKTATDPTHLGDSSNASTSTTTAAVDDDDDDDDTREMTAPGITEAEHAALREANAGKGRARLTAEEKRAAKQAMQLEAEEEASAVREGIAHFRGEKTVLIVREREHVMGRRTKDTRDDPNLLDVSEEGTASKVSRKQAILRVEEREDPDGDDDEEEDKKEKEKEKDQEMVPATDDGEKKKRDKERGKDDYEGSDGRGETTTKNGEVKKKKKKKITKRRKKGTIFTLENVGKRDLAVNGNPLRRHQRIVLPNHAFLEMPGHIAFTFHIHRGQLCRPQKDAS